MLSQQFVVYDVAALVCTLFTQSMPAPAFVTRSLQPLLSLTTKIQFAKFIISHFEMMKGSKILVIFIGPRSYLSLPMSVTN